MADGSQYVNCYRCNTGWSEQDCLFHKYDCRGRDVRDPCEGYYTVLHGATPSR